jgi:hypothetical protein
MAWARVTRPRQRSHEKAQTETIYLASSTLSALPCFGVALSNHLLPALAFRAIAGVALAGI